MGRPSILERRGQLRRITAPVDPDLLARMRDAMIHRGPDDAGQKIFGHVGIAMRRLSIIDLSTGHQPIANEDGTVWTVFNGEIYNYRELRSELKGFGHHFSTDSDTEVIVHAYEQYGDDCVNHFNGMFGFAIWDTRQQRLLLARDRLGIKPLYYAKAGSSLVFASELKSLLQHPAVPREIDPISLSQYLMFEYVPAPRTMFQGVSKMLPGTRMALEDGRLAADTYWDVQFQPDESLRDEEACKTQIREHLREAVRLRLRSDVPLGVLLSGGIDSSSIAAMMKSLDCPIHSFSIGFHEPEYNELDAARGTARFLGADHTDLHLNADDVTQLMPRIVEKLDEPIADASIVPTFLVCQLARTKVTVALSGDGGDELFGGYETYKAYKIAKYYRQLPGLCQKLIYQFARALPPSRSHRGLSFKAQKFTSGVQYPPLTANSIWWGAYPPKLLHDVLAPGVSHDCQLFDPIFRVEESLRGSSGLDQIFYSDLKLYLQDDLLVKVDRMSMANSLEVRVPFLDHNLVEFAARIPHELKVRGLKLKYILRQAMRECLPPEITELPKRGFDIPLDTWIRGPLREFTTDMLSGPILQSSPYFNASFVQQKLDEHLKRHRNNRQLLWPIIVFESWRRQIST